MMHIGLLVDYRIIDGAEAVSLNDVIANVLGSGAVAA